MPARRLIFAYLTSLLLHLAVLAGSDLAAQRRRPPPRPTPAMLEATLLLPPAADPEALLKNTLAASDPVTTPPAKADTPGRGQRRSETDKARRKLAEHLYYPPEAVAQGLEGEVRLLLSLEVDGSIADAQVASSSGHALLDQAAVRAAWAMGRLADVDRRELILPVRFRLRP